MSVLGNNYTNNEQLQFLADDNAITGGYDRSRYLYYQLKFSISKAVRIDIIVSFLMESGVKLILNDLSSIQLGSLKLYAVDQSTEVYDYTDVFDQIEAAFNAFKQICERPKSHLKAVNEVRPIETVKRIGYESIPYLAAHSEDWLARTASGLKPARLFSRVEEDEYQIYENRVVIVNDKINFT